MILPRQKQEKDFLKQLVVHRTVLLEGFFDSDTCIFQDELLSPKTENVLVTDVVLPVKYYNGNIFVLKELH